MSMAKAILGRPVRLAVVGSGERGKIYAGYALDNPSACNVVAVAEPSARRRAAFAKRHPNVQPSNVFSDWRLLAAQRPRPADAVAICLLDPLHAEAVVAFAEAGYHVLCEKPMAIKPLDCKAIVDAVTSMGTVFAVCHVLRYSPYNVAIKNLIDDKACGDLINVVHVEPVGWWHFAHSYVRGNWAREDRSTFSLMAKSCHDLDILCHYIGHDHPPERVHSFGSLTHFRRVSKPVEAGSATRCLECQHEPDCPYSAPRLYLDPRRQDERGWPASVLISGGPSPDSVEPPVPTTDPTTDPLPRSASTAADIEDALRTGPYGRCVYECDNDVCDHQVVNIQFKGGPTASFTMVGFSGEVCERQTRIHGSRGQIVGNSINITVTDFVKGTTRVLTPEDYLPRDANGELHPQSSSGHGGGDHGLMDAFIGAIRDADPKRLGCTPSQALLSHALVFAAEEARLETKVVDMMDFMRRSGMAS
ncbi:hypothetical protein HKX48_000550 [Thoreauomyces humboldtii]|nr:hypothetical protein HKX48_000550 [Thoreauomyces humboldtii]